MMKKTVMLLPVKYNDGSDISANLKAHLLSQIANIFGGYTIDGQTTGVYRMADGSMAIDVCDKVIIGVDESDIGKVREVAGNIARVLRQESLYFEVQNGAEIEFIAPSVECPKIDYFGGSPGPSNVCIAA